MSNQSNRTPAFDGDIKALIKAALAEDIGSGDITSQLLVPEHVQARMDFVAREALVACGTFVPEGVYAEFAGKVSVSVQVKEGQRVEKGAVLAAASGSARTLLIGERTVLNLMQRMSGVASLTALYVEKVAGTKAIILDTRKTMPGLRRLDKYAVVTGGGQNHRMGLWDMVLVKDNHIALQGGGSGIKDVVEQVRQNIASLVPRPSFHVPIVVECDTLAQVEEVLAAKPDRILLDNMDVGMLKQAVALAAGRVKLEASGGVSLETVRTIAETGVDYISVGRITHSAPAADVGADITY